MHTESPLAIDHKFIYPCSKHRFCWLVLARIDLNAVLVEGPERVPEQTRRIILLLERDEALPVLAKRSGHARGQFVASEELCIAPLLIMTLIYARGRRLTEGKAPPLATGLIVSRSHWRGGGEE